MVNLYAWTTENTAMSDITIYTLTDMPSAGDLIYKSDGTPYDMYELNDSMWACRNDITSYSNNTITITGDAPY